MITILARWEDKQMSTDTEWKLWRQLKGFRIDNFVFASIEDTMERVAVTQCSSMGEALTNVVGNLVFLEPTGLKGMSDLPPRNEDVVFVLGNTTSDNLEHVAPVDAYRINEPNITGMYPVCAAAIVLAYWHGQQ